MTSATPDVGPVQGSDRAPCWATLYRAAGAAAAVTVLLIAIHITVFIAYPFPETVSGWYTLLQDNPLAGLIDLDLLLVADDVLLVVIALAVYVALKPVNPSVTTIATGLWFLAITLLIAANPALQMLSLSEQFTASATDAERSATLAAGQSVLTTWEGTGFHISYIIGQIAGITLGIIMLKSTRFGRAVPYAMIAGNVVGFGYYLPTAGLAISAFSGVILWVWYVLITRRFFKLTHEEAPRTVSESIR